MTHSPRLAALITVVLSLCAAVPALAHSGPPYPAVSDQVVGAYSVTVWTDPDTTDDGSAQGKFWITMQPARRGTAPADVRRVSMSIKPSDRPGDLETAVGDRVKTDPLTYYAALPMGHEGPFAVHVSIDGGAGQGELDCEVQATYDLRPARFLLALYVMPFLLVALLWGKLILARRRATRPEASATRATT